MTKTWRFDDLAPAAERFYRDIEREFSIHVYHPIPETRFCLNADDAKRAQRRIRNPRYANVLHGYSPAGEGHPSIHNPHGSFSILGAAYVDLPLTIRTLRDHFAKTGRLSDEIFEYNRLSKEDGRWSYQGKTYERVIFCEGAALKQNPWFRHLPLTPAKGETLLCRCDALELPQQLLHHKKWLLPYPDGRFRLGATFEEGATSDAPTEDGARQLLEGFDALTKEAHEPKVEKHLAGIRPSTDDARPFLGEHPDGRGLFIMNGLGSKGASLAPALSQELVAHIFTGATLDHETDIKRFQTAHL